MEIFLTILAIALGFGVFLPLLDAEHWTIRGQEYIKPFYLALCILVFLCSFLTEFSISNGLIFYGIIISAIFYCLNKFLPLTSFFKSSMEVVVQPNKDRQISLLVFNVLQKNKQYEKLIAKANELKPDLIFLLETDEAWDRNLEPLYNQYLHVKKAIRNDTYGFVMMTNLDLDSADIVHQVSEQIPSMDLRLDFLGKKVQIYGLHPKPPIAGESLYSSKKDKEFEEITLKIKHASETQAHMVIGDFNEVSWGRSFKKFWKNAKLHDPRRGRYFKPTFPSYLPLRVPLDHALFSEDFQLVSFEVIKDLGSDHFAIHSVVQLR